MCDDDYDYEPRFTSDQLLEIEQKLAQTDQAGEIQVCAEYDINPDDVFDFMTNRGYDWDDDHWVARAAFVN